MEGCLTQGLVALTGLRTLGFGADRPYRGLLGRWGLCRRWDPGFGRPCRAAHPGLWRGIAPIGACTAVGGRPGLHSRSPAGATRRAALSYRAVLLSRVVRGEVLCPDSRAPW